MFCAKNIEERYELSKERIKYIKDEKSVGKSYLSYFKTVSRFLENIHELLEIVEDGAWDKYTLDEMQTINKGLYSEVLSANYETSYTNPTYAEKELGEYGSMLSFLFTELRGAIAYIFEEKKEYVTICNELFIAIYNCFEEKERPEIEEIKEIIYWYASDYCDVFLADRIKEQIDPSVSFATKLLETYGFKDDKDIYRYGEYISDNELETARHLRSLPEEIIQKMADVYTEGYRQGFISGGKDLSKKSVVNIRYIVGFERVIKLAIQNFEKMGLRPSIYRAAVSVITKKEQLKIGYLGAVANKQYEYDHRADQGLFLDKKYIERKLDITKNVYESNKELAVQFAGPAVMEVFGETPFAPKPKAEVVALDKKQEEWSRLYDMKASQIVNQYIKGEERSFTIIAYPVPEIGTKYKEIFDEVIKINTLDGKEYAKIQQYLIDALDQGDYVHIKGKDNNKTDLKVQLYTLNNPQKETIFENCVADVNIPVGEVFTTPVLKGTEGILHVSKVFLNELQYKELQIEFQDGKIKEYSCKNFQDEKENQKYIYENILHNHETLPLGEFAIGTNTTAYVVAKKYQIEDKMPILIAEKMGPHFAVGDTCFSWSEDNKVYNPDGKEIVAKDNEVSILRKKDINKAYLQCHTDITIPYEELEEISVITIKGDRIPLILNGRFVLPGTEKLNEPLNKFL